MGLDTAISECKLVLDLRCRAFHKYRHVPQIGVGRCLKNKKSIRLTR
jgi:hypothetical protein